MLADGTAKNIEEIEIGDEVLASDPRSGETSKRTVSRLIVTDDDKHFNELKISTSAGVEELTATFEHPFWSPSQNAWVDAADLVSGMTLLTSTGETVTVVNNVPYQQRATTYNLTIEDLRTYYVLAGSTPILVHNSNCSISMEEAVNRAVAHVGDNATVVRSGSGGVQFMSVTTDASGNTVRKIARFDVNPNSPHVQKLSPHLNLETQINGKTATSGPLKDPHTGIDPSG
ncbi:polymorphic toxin-type HINT domain-containing protein [Streptomyces sp. NPDC051366]|uniref:polymorphic toxin-type HINT domain-containing protein n=1 Tax=Streptomyces sp. NPDC051366 TaxID=3365652 RepID=UPI00379539CC